MFVCPAADGTKYRGTLPNNVQMWETVEDTDLRGSASNPSHHFSGNPVEEESERL